MSSGIALPWQDWGYEVCALCVNGQEVLERLEECRPDVVLSDIRMPGIDGVELMQRAADRLLCDRKGGSGHREIFPQKSPGRAAGSGVTKNFAAKKNSAPHRSFVRGIVSPVWEYLFVKKTALCADWEAFGKNRTERLPLAGEDAPEGGG